MFSYFTESCHPDGLHGGKKTVSSVGYEWIPYSSSSFSCVISNFTDATVERWDMACVSIHGAVLSTVTFVLGKVTTMCQEKYFPDCCQHELLFLVELFRGQVGRGGRCWHKLYWWHVGLACGCLKRTGRSSLNYVSQGGCAWEGWGGVNCSLVIQDGHWPVCAAEIEVDTSCFSGSRLRKRFHSSLSKVILQLLIQDGK